MNYSRVAVAAVAATLACFTYGYLVYGNLLTASYAAQGGIYRTADAQMANMPVGAAGVFAAMVAAVLLFARGSRRGAAAGATFGLLLAIFAIGTCGIVNYATINMSGEHAARMCAAALGEWLGVGLVIGLTYRD